MIYKNLFSPAEVPLPKFEDGDEVHGGNFARPYTGRPDLIDGGRKVLFVNCNLMNCATTIPSKDCNTYNGEIPTEIEPTEAEKDIALKDAVERAAIEIYGSETAKVVAIRAAVATAVSTGIAPKGEDEPIEDIKVVR